MECVEYANRALAEKILDYRLESIPGTEGASLCLLLLLLSRSGLLRFPLPVIALDVIVLRPPPAYILTYSESKR